MAGQESFTLLRTILRALGLSAEAIDDIVARILDLLTGREGKADQIEFPYHIRDDFLSPAEQSFYLVLRTAVADWATICPKVNLGDLFYAKIGDPSIYRTCTNRIDRKHVDFLLCDPQTVKPLLGIELDDRSHQRADRQARDEFGAQVFSAAQLPLVRLSARRAYAVAELTALLREKVDLDTEAPAITPSSSVAPPAIPPPLPPVPNPVPAAALPAPAPVAEPPRCPQCGSPMVLRTASRGSNQGGHFWGCPNYPRCRGIVKYEVKD
jgi:hypothetical protein